MGHVCTHGDYRGSPPPNGEHPIIAVLAVIAIIAAILLITWAGFEVHGTGDLEAALGEGEAHPPKAGEQRQVDEAVTTNRFATGLSP